MDQRRTVSRNAIARRRFLLLLGGAMGLPRLARAQGAPNLRLGQAGIVFDTESPLFDRLAELGYIEGRNYTLDRVDLTGHMDRDSEAWKEIVARKPDILLAVGPEEALKDALAATRTVPIVMIAFDFDPVALGYATSLARPGGNLTGFVTQQIELTVKRLQYVRDILPDIRAATMFWDRFGADQWHVASKAAGGLGLEIAGVEFKDEPYDYERALAQVPPEARKILTVTAGPIFIRDRARLAAFALAHGAASVSYARLFVDAGGFMSYGVSSTETFWRAAEYIDRIARGAKPAELPIIQPTTFELVINQKTAKALGITVPPAMLVRAEAVIE